jgi:amino acid transporter
MQRTLLFGLSAALGLIYSPDHLRLWGNLAGSLGPFFWIAVLFAAILYSSTAVSYSRIEGSANGRGYLTALNEWGGVPAVALLLSSRLVLLLGVSTGILVTAGFVFNEVFVYWFPNFAFAFLMLALVAITHLFGYSAAERLQSGLLTVTLGGLIILILAGFGQPGQYSVFEAVQHTKTVPVLFSGALLLFVGCDLGIHRFGQTPANHEGPRAMLTAIGISAALLGLWGTVSLMYVSAEKLSESFIPFTLAARQIGGQTGRMLMGIVVITGAGCAVLGLFSAMSQLVTALADQQPLSMFLIGSKRRNIPATLVWTLAIAALMAFGFAGSPLLELFIRAGFLTWVLHMILVQLMAASRSAPRTASIANVPWYHLYTWKSFPAAVLLIAGAGCLWMTDAQRLLLTFTIVAAWGGGMVVLFIAQWSLGRN